MSTEELKAALKPFADFVKVNDHDTLSSLRGDDEVISTAKGSWSRPASITLGDIRRLAAAYEKLG